MDSFIFNLEKLDKLLSSTHLDPKVKEYAKWERKIYDEGIVFMEAGEYDKICISIFDYIKNRFLSLKISINDDVDLDTLIFNTKKKLYCKLNPTSIAKEDRHQALLSYIY